MSAWTLQNKIDFIKHIYGDVSTVSENTGISARFIFSQIALETGWGRKILPDTNNIFNIKADSSWSGPTATYTVPEYINGEWVLTESEFRVYNSYADSIQDWVNYLQNNSRYSNVFDPDVKGDLYKVAKAMQDAHFGTDPNYASKIIRIAKGPTMGEALAAVNSSPSVGGSGLYYIPDVGYVTDEIYNLFTTAGSLGNSFIGSPVILDLDGDGVETMAVADGAYFDHDGNGFAGQTGWASSDDGLLVMDRNGDGKIDTGKELFGDQTLIQDGQKAANGFQALAELDGNSDGTLDSNDAAYVQLKIWQDLDGDGYASADEIKTLSELGIASINTGYTTSTFVDTNGNEHKQVGSFTKTDGTAGTATDVWFKMDKMYTIANEWLDVPEAIAALPDLQGYGNVYDLHQAMVRDTSGQLQALVESFITAADSDTRTSLMDQILYKWTGSEEIDPTSRGFDSWYSYEATVDARQLATLEQFLGQGYYSQVGTGSQVNALAGCILTKAYHTLSEMFYGQLMSQTHLQEMFSEIAYSWDDTSQSVKGELSAVTPGIQALLASDPDEGKNTLGEFVRSVKGLMVEETLNFDDFRSEIIAADRGLDFIFDTAGLIPKLGTSGSDTIYLRDGANLVDGGAGDDFIEATGGTAVFHYGIGSGNDTITNADYQTLEDSYYTIWMGYGLTADSLSFTREIDQYGYSNLIITINSTQEKLTLRDWFNGGYHNQYHDQWYANPSQNKSALIKFTDGTVLTIADILAQMPIMGTNIDDTIYGTTVDHMLSSGAGNDMIYAGPGDDTLDGGTNNDTLVGGKGSDTYILRRGEGQDTIIETYQTGDVNAVQFGEGITADDVVIGRTINDLIVAIKVSPVSLIRRIRSPPSWRPLPT